MIRSRYPLFVVPLVFVIFFLTGCSANKTGSQWSLASINPFKKSQPDTPYPQKPSSFATPSPVPGESRGQMMADTRSRSGPLSLSTSGQVYPATQGSAESCHTGGQVTGIQTPPKAQPRAEGQASAGPTWYDPAGFERSQGQTVQAQAAGNAYATDSASSLNARQFAQAAGVTGQAPQASSRLGGSSGVAAAASMSPSPNVGIPVSYDATQYPSAPSPTSVTTVSQGAAWNQSTQAAGNPSSWPPSASAATGASSQTDWRQLVGDRYAQLYQQSGIPKVADPQVPARAGASTTPSSLGNTGYVPGQTPNPPGNIPYEPGNTGYRPPGVPPYGSPGGPQQSQWPSGASGVSASFPTPSVVPSANGPAEYRPGSTKSYTPRSAVSSAPTWGSTSSVGGMAGCDSLACPTPSRAETANGTESFRL